jgi:hypothetical protein
MSSSDPSPLADRSYPGATIDGAEAITAASDERAPSTGSSAA